MVTETGRAAFIAGMQEQGVKVKDGTIETVKETDFTLTQRGDVDKAFQGGIGGGMSKLVKTIQSLEAEHPEWFAERTSGKHTVEVLIKAGQAAFIAAMYERGVETRE